MFIFFYAGIFTSFGDLNTMVCLENIGRATREELKDFFASYT